MIIVYCETAIESLTDEDSGLLVQLNILMEDKYKKPKSEDEAFSDAKEVAQELLN